MANFGVISHSINGISYLILALLLLISWKGRPLGGILLAAVICQIVFSVLQILSVYSALLPGILLIIIEYLRMGLWVMFVLMVLRHGEAQRASTNHFVYAFAALIVAVSVLLLLGVIPAWLPQEDYFQLLYITALLFSILGIVLTEQLYRNIRQEKRWAFKFLCLGLGLLFAYDLYMYANATLLNGLDIALYDARGIATAIVVPLLAISASRNPEWSFDIFVSRQIIFYSTSLIAIGVYITIMAIGGYYVQFIGGEWGKEAQIVFFVGAGVVLLAVMSSGKTRTRIKLFLNKHFYKNKYDYREEWMRLVQKISEYNKTDYFKENILQTVAAIVHSRGGMLFLLNDDEYKCASSWNAALVTDNIPRVASLPSFLNKYEWVIDLEEYRKEPEKFSSLTLPPEIDDDSAWLIIPLKHYYDLIGFIVLLEPIVEYRITWEDRDLLKAVGRQVSSYLALMQANESLMEAEKFGAFNRLSAYVVHDMKNSLSQLELIVKNAEKFMQNPEFVADSFATVANVVNRMRRMLNQLKKVQFNQSDAQRVDVGKTLRSVVELCGDVLPVPELQVKKDNIFIYAEADRFQDIITHLVRNAQEATQPDGRIAVRMSTDDGFVKIEIEDNGCGMDQQYMNEYLFKPFNTTKGNAGMGIGVFEAKEFVKYYNGRIDVHSEVDKGAIFTLSIPQYTGVNEFEN